MSKFRNMVAAFASAVALSGGLLVAGPMAPAEASVACMPTTPEIRCSMYWANRTNINYAKYNQRNESVTNLQRALTQAKWPVGITGHYNSYTVRAVKGYQASRKLPVTGVVDYRTIHAMRVGAGGPGDPNATVSKASVAVKYAYAQVGKPYVYGATGPSAYDCSGLTGASWKSAGVSVSRTSYGQLSTLPAVSKSNLRPGDIVGFYSGSHVGIYVGSGYVIHASRPGVPVKKVAMSSMPYYKAVRPAA
ncbi:C40 family peptidase [Aestuariimicrobium ganziense]|uniref:C40 family peptidase n=1 Tax=Aestuariimicrobium ganziense TaxID=2773677 RepID=UPI0019414B85|nr:peptidoglycan-binding domain-containing protein [Aestuariimicrobium ganziense]